MGEGCQLSPHLHLLEQNAKEPEYSVSEPELLGSSARIFVKVGEQNIFYLLLC